MTMSTEAPAESTAPPVAIHKVLTGQKALVTGANSGIGRGVAIALGQAGADVVVNYVEGDGAAEAVVDGNREVRRQGLCAQGRRFFGTGGRSDVRANDAGIRHDRHPGQQRRPAARFGVSGNDAGEMEQGLERQSDRPILVRARGGTGIPAPRRGCVGVERRRQDHLHEFGASGDSVGRPCQLRHLQGRHQAADGKHGAGSRAEAHSRQRDRAGRDQDADQHRRLADQGGLRSA